MDKRSKVLLSLFLAVVTITVIVTWYRYVILGDIVFDTDSEAFAEALLEE